MQAHPTMLPLFKYLEQFHPLSNGFKADYEKNCTLIQVRKYKHIVSPIDNNTSVYFLVSGLVRGFIKDGKKDISTWFSFGNEIIGAIRHPDGQSAHSIEYLQALEHCYLIRIPYNLMEDAYSRYAEANVIGRKLLALHYHAASDRAILARIPNASKRYRKLESSNSDFEKVPKRYLASYLGIRLETMSRIGSKLLIPDHGATATQRKLADSA
ncbi:Crp/Fnr family transcriptional regulator [Pedobacter sp. GSP4]|uniref:Crp/Fnr family transcriptional regulator n=1 Tax=Pedobacter sp. GSP4 TaxID=3453716 RepID=UPI003EEB6391